MAKPAKYPSTRTTLITVALAALLLALAACSKPATTGPQLEEVAAWWETSPETRLNLYSSVEIEMAFRNLKGATVTFDGDTGTGQPEDELQIWTAPNLANPPVTFVDFPVGDYAPDSIFTWKLTIDLSALAATETKLGIRPDSASNGTLLPGDAELTEAKLTWVR